LVVGHDDARLVRPFADDREPTTDDCYPSIVQLKQALTAAIDTLTANAVGSPRMNAETLLMFVLNSDRAYLYAHPEYVLTSD